MGLNLGRLLIGFFGFLAFSFFSIHVIAKGNGDFTKGKFVYEKYCSSCHGQGGEGLGPVSGLPDFSNSSTLAKKTDKELFDVITNGGRGSGMPAWGRVLNEQERWDVLAYIRTLGA